MTQPHRFKIIILSVLLIPAILNVVHADTTGTGLFLQFSRIDHPAYSYLGRMQTSGQMPLLSSTRPYLGHVYHSALLNERLFLDEEDEVYIAGSAAAMRGIGQDVHYKYQSSWRKLRELAGLSDSRMPWLFRDGFHLASWSYDSTFSVAIQPVYGLEVISLTHESQKVVTDKARQPDTGGKDQTFLRLTSGVRIEGGYRQRLRFLMDFRDHTESGNGPYTSRSRLYEDRWASVDLKGGNSTSYDISESFLQYYGRNLSATVGRGRNYWGPARHGSLLLNSEMPPFDYVRWDAVLENARQQAIYYTFIHGWLESQLTEDTLYITPGGRPRTINQQKYLSAQRLEIRPRTNLLFGLSQAVVYGNRDVHISYLTPLNFLYSVQHSNDDKDNFLLLLDVNWRPINGVRVYGEALFDDIVVSALTTSSGSNKSAYTAGIHLTGTQGWMTHLDGGAEYTKIRPFVYSHIFAVNTFTHWTSPLGYTLQPNSEVISFDLRGTFYPIQISVNFQRRNHGANTENRDVGGDIYSPLYDSAADHLYPFLDGNPMHYETMTGGVEWEALPGLRLKLEAASVKFSQGKNRTEWRGGFGWNL